MNLINFQIYILTVNKLLLNNKGNYKMENDELTRSAHNTFSPFNDLKYKRFGNVSKYYLERNYNEITNTNSDYILRCKF